MAKRGRKAASISLDALIDELNTLEARRDAIVTQVRSALSNIGERATARVNEVKNTVVKAVKRGRRKMSDEARAKISAAQKARWAKSRKGSKKSLGTK
jgi:hypothetical protein